jgi:hypothetical protein
MLRRLSEIKSRSISHIRISDWTLFSSSPFSPFPLCFSSLLISAPSAPQLIEFKFAAARRARLSALIQRWHAIPARRNRLSSLLQHQWHRVIRPRVIDAAKRAVVFRAWLAVAHPRRVLRAVCERALVGMRLSMFWVVSFFLSFCIFSALLCLFLRFCFLFLQCDSAY